MRRSSRLAGHEAPESNAELETVSRSPTNEGVSLAVPEGGREAWICLLGSSLMIFPSFGFQTAGMRNRCFSNYSRAQYGC